VSHCTNKKGNLKFLKSNKNWDKAKIEIRGMLIPMSAYVKK
jgi:hypothetical protein